MARKNTTARVVKSSSNTMWGGRYKLGPAEIMEKINASIGFDRRLAQQPCGVTEGAHERA